MNIFPIESLSTYKERNLYPLDTGWVFWIQNSIEQNDYKFNPIISFNSVYGFSLVYNSYKNNIVRLDRYVFMREGINPYYEDKSHINGGQLIITFLSKKKNNIIDNNTQISQIHKLYNIILCGLVGESLTTKLFNSRNLTGITFVNNVYLKEVRIWFVGGVDMKLTYLDPEILDLLVKNGMDIGKSVKIIKLS